MDGVINVWLSCTISVVSLIISLIVLRIQIKDHAVQRKLYHLSIDEFLNSNAVIKLISSKQVEDKVSIKLVIYNLDSNPLLVQSLSIYKKERSKKLLKRLFNIEEYVRIIDSEWWPKYSESINTKFFDEGYENILIKDLMDFQMVFPGELNDDTCYFVLKTNRGSVTHSSSVKINSCYFPHTFYENRSYDM